MKSKDMLGAPAEDSNLSAYMSEDHHAAALTRAELSMLRAHLAFSRWAVELQKHIAPEIVSFSEISLLHCMRMRGANPSLSDLLLFMNRQDVPNIQYCLRKLEDQLLIRRRKGPNRGEAVYSLTERGMAITSAYAAKRTAVLVAACKEEEGFDDCLETAAATLESLVGLYDRSTRAVLTHRILGSRPARKADPG